MADELEGPYKLVGHIVSSREPARFSIVFQESRETYLSEYLQDAGDGKTARHLCNLLNKDYKEVMEMVAMANETTDDSQVIKQYPEEESPRPRNYQPWRGSQRR